MARLSWVTRRDITIRHSPQSLPSFKCITLKMASGLQCICVYRQRQQLVIISAKICLAVLAFFIPAICLYGLFYRP